MVGIGAGRTRRSLRNRSTASPPRWRVATAPTSTCARRPRLQDLDLRAPRVAPPAGAGRDLLRRPWPTGPGTPTASRTATSCGASAATSQPARRRRVPRDEADVVALLDWCAGAGDRRHPLRRRLVGRRRRRGRRLGDGLRRRGVASTSPALDRVRRDRPHVAGGAHPGRRPRARRSRTSCARTGSRCATSRSRSSSRRSAGGSRRARAATTPPCTRTSTTSWSRCGSSRRAGISESRRLPGLGRGPVARPAVPRLRGHARHHHRGVDAAPGPPPLEGVGGRALRRLRRRRRPRCARSRSRACSRPTAGCSIPARRCCRPGADGSAAVLVLGFESADHPVDAWMARAVELCADHGGDVPRRCDQLGPTAAEAATRAPARQTWRNAFLRAPVRPRRAGRRWA